jgi:hypothetical protein
MRLLVISCLAAALAGATYALAGTSDGARGFAPVFAAPTQVVPFSADDVGGATELETGDLNGDGLPDVVVMRITYPPAPVTHPIGIFLADSKGGFKDGSSMWDGPAARTEWGRQIVIADFNGDHRNDIFVADTGYDAPPYPGHSNELALSTPQGKLVDASGNLPPESGYTHSACAADVNGDGSTDLYIGNINDAPAEILLNDGTGHFTAEANALPPEFYSGGGFLRCLLVDVNGDGAPDLILGADHNRPDSLVLLNDGTGHFHAAPAPLPPKPQPFGSTGILISLASLDINGDGRPDLLAGFTSYDAFYVGRRIQVLINNGDGTFRDETALRLPHQDSGDGWPYAFRITDFNGDGFPDFTVDVNHYPLDPAPIYLNNGHGIFHPVPFHPASQLFGILDANGDGHPDVFSIQSGGGGGPEQHFLQLQITAPAAPTGLRATGGTDGIHLTWSTVRGATGFQIWRSTGRKPMHEVVATPVPSWTDSRTRPLQAYTYAVRATNSAGAGPLSRTATARRR